MAVSAQTLGPGQLTIGETGTLRQFGASVATCKLTPSVADGETIYVLDGSEAAEDDKETWTLEGTVYQTYDLQSLIKWCNDNAGEELPFTFRANNSETLTASGTTRVRSIAYGGDVKKKNTSDFAFKVIGQPTFAAAA